jgi:uncharacterized protein YkwD
MKSRLTAGMAVSVVTAFVIGLAGYDPGPSILSPEVMAHSATPPSSIQEESADLEDRLPDESPPPAIVTSTTTTVSTTDTTTVSTTDTTTARSATATTTPPSTTTTTVAATTTTLSGGFNAGYEGSFASMINAHRSANGLPPLARNSSLNGEARAWSQAMATNGTLSHSDLGRFLPPWSSVGENVGVGGSVSSIFSVLTSSSGHNATMLGDFTHLGVGVWVDSAGAIWTTHIFTR